MTVRQCNCGSGKPSWWANDARGIPLARVCEDCEERRLGVFRPEVLTDSNYEADEPIEPDPPVPVPDLRTDFGPDGPQPGTAAYTAFIMAQLYPPDGEEIYDGFWDDFKEELKDRLD